MRINPTDFESPPRLFIVAVLLFFNDLGDDRGVKGEWAGVELDAPTGGPKKHVFYFVD